MEAPRLVRADEMDSLDGVAEVLEGRKVAVGGAEGQIVAKWESSRSISFGPVREVLIKQTLVTT